MSEQVERAREAGGSEEADRPLEAVDPTAAAVPAPSDGVPAPVAEPVPPATDAPLPAEAGPVPSGFVRAAGAVYLLAFGALFAFLATRVFGADVDLGTDNWRARLVIRAAIFIFLYPAALGGWALVRGLRPPAGANPLGLPFEGWWFATVVAMTWREVKGFFARPAAYIVITAFLAVNGILVFALIHYYTDPLANQQVPASEVLWGGTMFLWISLWLICPAVTMRLLAEEQRSGTLEGLLTAPVTDIQVVASKYAAAVIFFAVMLAVTGVYLVILRTFAAEWDWGPVMGGYLGLLLVGCLYMSVGLFTSSLTEHQVIAFVVALPIVFGFSAVSMLESYVQTPWLQATLRYASVHHHHTEMLRGVVQWKSLVFYLTSTFFFLFLAVRGVESHKWR